VVDVIDPVTGIAQLQTTVADAHETTLDTRSGRTVRIDK
jgi:hypothetical protein